MSKSILNDICDVCIEHVVKGDVDEEALTKSLWKGFDTYRGLAEKKYWEAI